MALPLLSSSYFEQPTASGQVSSKTADLIAAEGDHMAKRIEAQSYSLDAKMLSRPITDLYSSAYQKIAIGDFTGFADMQKARSLAIGNPILMKTMDDADHIAGQLASTVVAGKNQQSTQEFQMQKMKEQNEAIATRQENLARHTDERADARLRQNQQFETDRQADIMYKSQHDVWKQENYQGEKAYADAMKLYDKQMKAYTLQTSMGVEAVKPEKPEPFKPRPEPKLTDYLSKTPIPTQSKGFAFGTSGGLDANNLDLPSADSATGGGATGETLVPGGDVKTNPKPDFRASPRAEMPPPQEAATLPAQQQPPTSSQLDGSSGAPTPSPMPTPAPTELPEDLPKDANKSISEQFNRRVAEGKPTRGMVFGFDPDTQSGAIIHLQDEPAKVVEADIDVSAGKSAVKIKPSEKLEKTRDALARLGNAHGGQFGQWWARQTRLGNPVSIDELPPTGKGDPSYVARSAGQDFRDKQGNVIPMTKKLKEDLDLVTTSAGQILSVEFNKIPEKHLDAMRNDIISDAAKNPTTFNYNRTNAYAKAHGMKEITPTDVATAVDKLKATAATEVQKAHASSEVKEARARLLSEQGIPLPGQEKEESDQKIQAENSSKRLAEIPKEITKLQDQIKKIKSDAGSKLDEDTIKKMEDLQVRILRLEKDAKNHRQILTRGVRMDFGTLD